VTLVGAKNNDVVINYGELRALVVDDYPGMRSALKLTLSNFGVTRIDMAASASEVLFRVQNKHYDLVLCDFNLGDGRDGQQLLEEMRHRDLISLSTVFVMVTAEAGYEKVVATAELAPDDYMIKPFSAEVMRGRLDNILLRKLTFAKVYKLFEDQDLESAILGCDEIIRTKPKYVVDALRFKGELLNAMGRFDEAEALYRQIIEMRAIPWARLGLARALHNQKKEDEAEEILKDILDESTEMVSAYDLLSDVCLSKGDKLGAQDALVQGVAISGKTVRRQQKLGEVASDNGDLETAKEAYANALEKGRNSVFITAEDYGQLCRVQVEQGDTEGAMDTLRKSRGILSTTQEGQFVSAVVRGMAYAKSGNQSEANKAMDEAERLNQEGARTNERFMLDYAETCMSTGRLDQADNIIRDVARNAHDSDALLAKARGIYARAGRSEVGDKVLKDATSMVRSLNNEAVILAHRGNYETAIEKLRLACTEAPHNPRILMNTVWVILKHLETGGMNEELMEQALILLASAEKLAPGHARLATLRGQMRDVDARYGIRRRNHGH